MRVAQRSVAVLVLCGVSIFAQQDVRPAAKAPSSGPAQSAQPTREDVLKFFTAMRVKARMEEVRNLALEQARQSVRDLVGEELPNASKEQVAELEGMVDKMASNYTIQNTLEDMVPIYQKHLTKADLHAVGAFFSTPAGQRFLDKEPLITDETLRMAMAKTQAQVEATMAAINKRLEEMKKQ